MLEKYPKTPKQEALLPKTLPSLNYSIAHHKETFGNIQTIK
jgi:hypothetical protein